MLNVYFNKILGCFYEGSLFTAYLVQIPSKFLLTCSITNDYSSLTFEQRLNSIEVPDFFIYNSGLQFSRGYAYDFILQDFENNQSLTLTISQVRKIFNLSNLNHLDYNPDLQTFINNVISISDVYDSILDNFINFFKQYKFIISLNVRSYMPSESSGPLISVMSVANMLDIDIYKEPVDNTNVYQILNGVSQAWSTQLSQDDIDKINCIEEYNRNFILFHQNELSITENQSSSDSSSSVDLSTINTQLTNIANNLKVVEKDEQQQDIDVSIAEIEKNKQLYVVNNIDIADKISMKPKYSGYPDDEEVF